MKSRSDELTEQHIQVGLVYKQMLGVHEAESYLRSVGIAPHLIYRVLHTENHRHHPLDLTVQKEQGTGTS